MPFLNGAVPWLLYVKKMEHPVDLQRLNAQCPRETHQYPTPFQIASQVPPNFKKTLIDDADGYHAIHLHPDSQPLTKFISKWGCFHYLQMSQGFVEAGDVYTCRFKNTITNIPRKVKIIDGTL